MHSTVVSAGGISKLQLTSVAAGSAANVTIIDTADTEELGLTTAGQNSNVKATGTASKVLQVSFADFAGGATQNIDFGSDGAAGAGETYAQIASAINTQLNTAYGTTGNNYQFASFTSTGQLKLVDPTDTTGGGTVTVVNSVLRPVAGLGRRSANRQHHRHRCGGENALDQYRRRGR